MPEAAQRTTRQGVCLIVDDNRFDQRLMLRALNHAGAGAAVLIADTLRAARATLARQRVRFILLDNTLPDGHGADFALELAALPAFRGIPVVLITDWPSPFMYEKARKAGVRGVFGKAEIGGKRLAGLLAG